MDKQLAKLSVTVDELVNDSKEQPTVKHADKVDKPTVILMKIVGVVIHWDFYQILDDYFKREIAIFLADKWNDPEVKPRIEEVKKTALQDIHVDGCPTLKFDDSCLQSQQVESLASYCTWVVGDKDKESLRQSVVSLKFKVWSEGWKKETLKAP